MNEDVILVYTKEDFLDGTRPFEEVYKYIDNKFDLDRAVEKMSDMAKLAGVRNFKKLFKAYCDLQRQVCNPGYVDNASDFDGQEIELSTGAWEADEFGITKSGQYGEVVACVHPLLPVQRLVNIDTGIEKIKIAYRKGKNWRSVICDRKQLASANQIVGLSDYGVAVTSENAKYLVQYIHDVENLNYEKIPENSSVGRLGWIGEQGFSPYVEGLIFDGAISYKRFFDAVKQKGDFEKWLSLAREVRQGSVYARLLLAASFSSVLIEPCGGLPFFVHMWGGSGAGKTVGLMFAVSVWANPEKGRYWHTFDGTYVGQEQSANFLNSLPLVLDELQIIKDKKEFDGIIYRLSEGVGRVRGAKTGGLQDTPVWCNCILSSGEYPISTAASGAGAVNRVIEINCEDIRLFDDPIKSVEILRKNYGYAGKMFVEQLQKTEIMQEAIMLQKKIYKELSEGDTTEKQALSASLILAADVMSNKLIFHDDTCLTVADIEPFLSTKSEVSQNGRAYAWLCEWVAQYRNRFTEGGEGQDRWGKFEGESTVCIIRNIFDKACMDNGFNAKSFLTWLRGNGYIEASGKGFTKSKRIGGIPCNCVVLKMEEKRLENYEKERKDLDF